MKKKSLAFFLLFELISFAVQAVDSSSVWLETINPALKNKIKIKLLMNFGDTPKNQPDYPMVGVGDGLGIFQQKNETIILMDHELKEEQGGFHAHGEKGAFVSKWTIGKKGIIHGEDLIQRVALYNRNLKEYRLALTRLSKLCSADLPLQSALFFQQQDKHYGTQTRIFFSGEELSTKKYKRYGRAFAHVVDGDFAGTSFELPRFGKMAFENVVLNPYPQQHTIAMLLDDATNISHDVPKNKKEIIAIHKKPPSELYIYIGNKQQQAENPIEAAGLNNGLLYGIQVEGMLKEARQQTIAPQTPFKLIAMDDVINDKNGKMMQIQSVTKGVSQFLRIEDGAWNLQKNKPNEFFFTTTDKVGGNSRLYKLAFNDITQPLKGGVITVLLNGNQQGIEMMDNITVDTWGRVLIQEDPGNNDRLARIWLYDLNNKKLYEIARHKARYFASAINNKDFISNNEESSGIVHAFNTLGEGWYILDIQSHRKHPNPKIVEYGQLLKMFVPKNLP